MEKQLLHTPEGVRDIYNGECEERLIIEDCIHKVFKSYGYSDIMTPSFEFFDVFNKDRGSVAANNMYKFFDRDNNTMVMRPDITPGIARCAAKYFENETAPLRLCYMGNTFINNSKYQGRLKENTQAGCEFIGDSSATADAEMIALLVESILSTGLKEFQVEVGHVGFFDGIAAEAGLSEEAVREMKEIIRNKNLFSIETLLDKENVADEYKDLFYRLPQMFGDASILEDAAGMTGDSTALNAINHLKRVYELLTGYGFEKYVTFDLGVLSELDYYTGVIFKAYTYEVGEPIANGGRYDRLIGQFGSDKASIGFGITVDLLHLAIMRQEIEIKRVAKPKLIVSGEDNLNKAIRLAGAMRAQRISAVVSDKAYNNDKFDEIIEINEDILERYGIK